MAQEPLPRASVERDVERRVEERAGTELTTRHARLATRADEADRAIHARVCGGQCSSCGLGARHAADIDPADRRPGRDRLALGQRHAAECGNHEHDDGGNDDDNRRPAPAATPARRPGRREKDVRHPAETSRGSVKRV